MKSVFEYNSYRVFLNKAFAWEKSCAKGTSLATFGKTIGMSGSSVAMVLAGKRNLTIESIQRVAEKLKFSDDEVAYFEALVLRDQAGDRATRQHYDRRVRNIAESKRPKSGVAPLARVRSSDSRILMRWYYPALIVYLMDIENVREKDRANIDTVKIASMFGVPEVEIKRVLDLIESPEVSAVPKEQQIHLIFTKMIKVGPSRDFVLNVMRETLKKAAEVYGSDDSYFSTHALTISADRFPELRSELKKVVEKFETTETAGSEPPAVIQLSFQFFKF